MSQVPSPCPVIASATTPAELSLGGELPQDRTRVLPSSLHVLLDCTPITETDKVRTRDRVHNLSRCIERECLHHGRSRVERNKNWFAHFNCPPLPFIPVSINAFVQAWLKSLTLLRCTPCELPKQNDSFDVSTHWKSAILLLHQDSQLTGTHLACANIGAACKSIHLAGATILLLLSSLGFEIEAR